MWCLNFVFPVKWFRCVQKNHKTFVCFSSSLSPWASLAALFLDKIHKLITFYRFYDTNKTVQSIPCESTHKKRFGYNHNKAVWCVGVHVYDQRCFFYTILTFHSHNGIECISKLINQMEIMKFNLFKFYNQCHWIQIII